MLNLFTPALCLAAQVQLSQMDPREPKMTLEQFPILTTSLCHLQREITDEALSYILLKDLESKWMVAPSAERRQHVLVGLSNVCSKARNLNDARAFCSKEMRVSYLCQGRNILDLLDLVKVDDVHVAPSTPKYVPDADWDVIRAKQERSSSTTEMERICLTEILLLRGKLICKSYDSFDT